MVDPRLNSIHLETPRRQDFRRAREALFDARGCHTFCAEQGVDDADEALSNTLIQKGGTPSSVLLECWLADERYIYPLRVGLNTLGRSADNDVVVADSCTSRRHCVILIHAQRGYELHDTASKNGTYLNGVKLARPAALHSGDAIRICDRQFTFMTRGGSRQAAPSPTALL